MFRLIIALALVASASANACDDADYPALVSTDCTAGSSPQPTSCMTVTVVEGYSSVCILPSFCTAGTDADGTVTTCVGTSTDCMVGTTCTASATALTCNTYQTTLPASTDDVANSVVTCGDGETNCISYSGGGEPLLGESGTWVGGAEGGCGGGDALSDCEMNRAFAELSYTDVSDWVCSTCTTDNCNAVLTPPSSAMSKSISAFAILAVLAVTANLM